MLRQGSAIDLRKGNLSRRDGYIVVAMAYYPRGLPVTVRDEYRPDLAPTRELFKDWQAHAKDAGHDEAFALCDYENRFVLGPDALLHLKDLAALSRTREVYLVCQCDLGQRCHRELLLWTAREAFGAQVRRIYHEYPVFQARIPGLVEGIAGAPGTAG